VIRQIIDHSMSLKILNSLTGEKESFTPLTAGHVRMYVCGVTVYDSAHLGHCRFLLTFDVIYRYLRFRGLDVTYVRNFTDVDDKIIRRAQEEQVSCDAITERYIAEFERDSEALGLLKPTLEPRATGLPAERSLHAFLPNATRREAEAPPVQVANFGRCVLLCRIAPRDFGAGAARVLGHYAPVQ